MNIYCQVTRTQWRIKNLDFYDENDKLTFYSWLARKAVSYLREAIGESGRVVAVKKFGRFRSTGLRISLMESYAKAQEPLRTNLRYWEEARTISIGYGPSLRNKDLDKARLLEYGTLDVPPQPVFRGARRHFEKNITHYYEEFRRRTA